VTAVISADDLNDVVLVGHSYAGMLAQGVAAQMPDRVAAVDYFAALVPRAGESKARLIDPSIMARRRTRASDVGGGWPVPPDDDRIAQLGLSPVAAWASGRCTHQPLGKVADLLLAIDTRHRR